MYNDNVTGQACLADLASLFGSPPFSAKSKSRGGGRGGIVVSAPHGTLGMRPLKCHLEETEPRRNHCSSLSLLSFITFF